MGERGRRTAHAKTANLKGVLHATVCCVQQGEEEDYEKYGKGVT